MSRLFFQLQQINSHDGQISPRISSRREDLNSKHQVIIRFFLSFFLCFPQTSSHVSFCGPWWGWLLNCWDFSAWMKAANPKISCRIDLHVHNLDLLMISKACHDFPVPNLTPLSFAKRTATVPNKENNKNARILLFVIYCWLNLNLLSE
jgi:hypothetical protein